MLHIWTLNWNFAFFLSRLTKSLRSYKLSTCFLKRILCLICHMRIIGRRWWSSSNIIATKFRQRISRHQLKWFVCMLISHAQNSTSLNDHWNHYLLSIYLYIYFYWMLPNATAFITWNPIQCHVKATISYENLQTHRISSRFF